MIVSKVYGGLAGQMFQYALGRHLSLKNNTELYLDISWYKKERDSNFVRDFSLCHLNTTYNILDKTSLLWWKTKFRAKSKNINLFNFRYIRESDFSQYDAKILELKSNIILDGYWNSHKYFQSIKELLVTELQPKEQPDRQNRECLKKIREVNSVSVHFRRGDYALTSFHGMLSKQYYEQAITNIAQKISDPYLFIFSDEPDWVLSNMEFHTPFEVINFNKDKKNYWDIELMKNCKHNIIANSGFSWWGAWLNNNEGKIVIAPERWVNIEKSKFDNIPKEWLLF